MDSLTELFGEPISVYTRAQALEDGALVDVSTTAREAGIRYPVALTAAAYNATVAWTPDDEAGRPCIQDEAGRLWDVVYMTSMEIRRSPDRNRVTVRLYVIPPAPSKARNPKLTELVAVCGPGDNAEPVITIMLPTED